jgi:hypothetical protein
VDLERGPFSLVSTTEDLLERKSSGSGLQSRENRGIPCTDHATPMYSQKLTLTSPTSGGHSVGIVRSRTKATELCFDVPISSTRPPQLSLILPTPVKEMPFALSLPDDCYPPSKGDEVLG